MKTEKQQRTEMRATPAGKILWEKLRLDYYDTESMARRVAERWAQDDHLQIGLIRDLREIICRDFMPQLKNCTCQDYGQLNDALMRASILLGPYEKKKS